MLLALSAAFIFGCKKDDDNTNTGGSNGTKTNLTKTWQAQAVEGITGNTVVPKLTVYTKGGSANLYDFSTFSVNFKSDGTFQQTGLDGTNSTGTWTLGSDNKTITMTSTGGSVVTYTADPVTAQSATFKYILNVKNPKGIDAQIINVAQSKGLTINDGAYLNLVVIPK